MRNTGVKVPRAGFQVQTSYSIALFYTLDRLEMFDSFEEEEKILLEREYTRHLENIEKSEIRERHFKLKEIGYNLSIDSLHNDANLISVFLGYVEAIGMDKDEVYRGIAKALLSSSSSITSSLRKILTLRIKDKNAIIEEITKIE